MMIAPAPLPVSPVCHDLENFLPPPRESLLRGLAGQLQASTRAADQNLGHLEEQLLRGGHELFRQMLEQAAQEKAAAAPPVCPHCQNQLRCLTQGHGTTVQTRWGRIRGERARGHCRRCKKWRFPADALLGLPEQGTQSPGVQEIAALVVSKMPAPEAEQVVERLTGVPISAGTLARAARVPGQRAQEKRQHLDEQMSTPEGRQQQDGDLQLQLPLDPFTLVIELDAWNTRERDEHWGRSAALRAQTTGGRPVILSRGTVMTRGGVDALKEQLWAEAQHRGLGFGPRSPDCGRRRGVDLEPGRRPLPPRAPAGGFLSCEPAPVGGGAHAPSRRRSGGPRLGRAAAGPTQG